MASPDKRQYVFDSPGTYHVRVEGRLDERWSDRLGGMTIGSEEVAGKKAVTTLTGTVVDQAALAGVLDGLFNLGLTLLSVERVEEDRS